MTRKTFPSQRDLDDFEVLCLLSRFAAVVHAQFVEDSRAEPDILDQLFGENFRPAVDQLLDLGFRAAAIERLSVRMLRRLPGMALDADIERIPTIVEVGRHLVEERRAYYQEQQDAGYSSGV